MFVRVRGARPGDPLHEFDVPLSWARSHADRYEVIDSEPVAAQRPASHVPGVVLAPELSTLAQEPSVKPARKRAPSPGENSIAPSAGVPKEETDA